MSFEKYVKNYFAIVLSLLSLVMGVNLLVDPYGTFGLLNLKGFNLKKPFAERGGMRRFKATNFLEKDYQNIILGHSRALGALDPEHKSLANQETYNLALGAANIYEIYQVFEYAKQNTDLKKVILPLNFDMFLDNKQNKVVGDFNKSKFSSNNLFFANFEDLLTLEQFKDSIMTVAFNRENKTLSYSNKGLRELKLDSRSQRQWFEARLVRTFQLDSKAVYNKASIEKLKKIIEYCQSEKIQLYLFIAPIHALHLESINVMGQYSQREKWLKDLVFMLEEFSDDNFNLILWDFSGYNSVTTEAVPRSEDNFTMKWYIESSHFNKNLGNMILDKVLNYPHHNQSIPNDFGIIINIDNIDFHLANTKTERVYYLQKFSQEIKEVKKIFYKTLSK